MAFGFTGCNPSQTWDSDDGRKAPPLGTVSQGNSPDGYGLGTYILIRMRNTNDAAKYDLISIGTDGIGEIANTAANTLPGARLCIPQVKIDQNDYGWALIKGVGKVAASNVAIADNATLAATSTAGKVDDASTFRISGLRSIEAKVGTTANQSIKILANHPIIAPVT